MTTEPWAPLDSAEVADLLRAFDGPWWIGGGQAIDLFVGRTTRDHGDIDVVVLRDHWDGVASLLSTWDFRVGTHEVWARTGPDARWSVEFLLEEREGNDWVYRRQPEVRLPLLEFGRMSPSGIPYERPEVVLLYKSKLADEERNVADLHAALPHLGIGGRAWLAGALDLCSPGHPWQAALL